MDEKRSKRHVTRTRCRFCGNETERTQAAREAAELRAQGRTFQVVIACAACGAPFAALARN